MPPLGISDSDRIRIERSRAKSIAEFETVIDSFDAIILPTTPFLLVALWAFARSSPALDNWLRTHKTLGPYIEDWDRYKVVPVKAKVLAVTMMSASFMWLALVTNAPVYALIITGILLASVAPWLITRPSHRPGK